MKVQKVKTSEADWSPENRGTLLCLECQTGQLYIDFDTRNNPAELIEICPACDNVNEPQIEHGDIIAFSASYITMIAIQRGLALILIMDRPIMVPALYSKNGEKEK